MRRLCQLLFVLLCISLLVSCSMSHKYAYTPPDSAADRICVAHCSSGKSHCQKICKMKYDDCKRRGGLFCKEECPCVDSYNTCYTACGGQVRAVL